MCCDASALCDFVVVRFYIALFSALEQHHWARMRFYMSEQLFIARFWISTEVVYCAGMAGATWNSCRLVAFCEHNTTMNYVTSHTHTLTMQSHIRKVHACVAVTCHLYFWQNDRGILRAAAVTRGWNGYRNKSQHRKLTLEKKTLPPLLQGLEPATF